MKVYEYTNQWMLVVNADKTCQTFYDGASFVSDSNTSEHIVFDTEQDMHKYITDNDLMLETTTALL